MIIVFLCVLGFIVCYIVQQSREGMARIPFDSTYVSSTDKYIVTIAEDLEKAGFNTIDVVEDNSGLKETNCNIKLLQPEEEITHDKHCE